MKDEEIMQLAKRRVNTRTGFFCHLRSSVGLSVMMSIIYFATTPGEYFWPVWAMFAQGISLVAHGIAVFPQYFRRGHGDKVAIEYEQLKRKYNNNQGGKNDD